MEHYFNEQCPEKFNTRFACQIQEAICTSHSTDLVDNSILYICIHTLCSISTFIIESLGQNINNWSIDSGHFDRTEDKLNWFFRL